MGPPQVDWVIGAVCVALAIAVELSERTFSATAALIGAAMLALMRLIAARSGSSSPAIALSSSRVSLRYSSAIVCSSARLRDRCRLLRVRVGDRAVGRDVQRGSEVD